VTSVALRSSPRDGISLLASLISDINSKQTAKRTLFSNLPFELGVGKDANGKEVPFKISVKGYNILQKQKPARSCYVYEDGEHLQIAEYVHGDSKQMAEGETIAKVNKPDVIKAYKFGGETVSFTTSEIEKLKFFGEPVLRIIGFKPQSMLPFWAAIKKSTFIYPSEEDYVGSTRVFSALWHKLLKDKKMGIAWFIARKRAQPQLVAILPSEEKLDNITHGQVFPAGLWLYPLPFADDVRYPPPQPKEPLVASNNLIEKMHKILGQLQLPGAVYHPSKYPNPSLQWHYKILQAMALEEEMPETPEDKTVPKYRQIQKRAGEYSTYPRYLDGRDENVLQEQWTYISSLRRSLLIYPFP
jgi:ATP-dependent DNA helicase 2 subunit 1